MTEIQLRKKFLAWWQPRNPRGRLWRNNSGAVHTSSGGYVKYGIPPGSGGSDLIGINDGQFVARELKTLKDTLKKDQADFLTLVKSLGGDAGLVLENPYSELGFDEKLWNENLRSLVK